MPDYSNQTRTICASLQVEAMHAQGIVATSIDVSGSAKGAIMRAIAADLTMIARLDTGDLFKSLQAGTFTLARWLAIAQTTHEDLNFQAGLNNEWSFSGVLSATVNQTSSDVAALPGQLLEDHWPLALAGVGVFLLLVWLRVA